MELIEALAACCAPRLARAPLSRTEATELAEAIRVLADPARLQILSVISAMPGAEACVCTLTEPLGLSQPTVSHHLKLLHDAGLLEREQRGRWVFYRLGEDRLRSLRDAIGEPVTL